MDNLPVFLSCLSLNQYHGAEELFTQELTTFTKKQFFEARFLKLLLYIIFVTIAVPSIHCVPNKRPLFYFLNNCVKN